MSLLIRKSCQPVLDAAGYPMFHCTTDNSRYEPHLVIFTSCGKPFVEVHGVRFSRYKPVIAECESSGELLKQWLDRHLVDFEEYVEAYTDFYSAEAPNNILSEPDLEITMFSERVDIRRNFHYVDDDGTDQTYGFKVSLDPETYCIKDVAWHKTGGLLPADLAKHVLIPKAILNKATKLRETHRAYWDMKKRYEVAKEKISTCKI